MTDGYYRCQLQQNEERSDILDMVYGTAQSLYDSGLMGESIPSLGIPKSLKKEKSRTVAKEVEGKATGARYFYIDSLPAAYPHNKLSPEVCRSFSQFVELVDKQLGTVGHINTILTHCRITDELLAEVIALRYQAVADGKYTAGSYKKPIPINLLLDAAARHLAKHYMVSTTDTESGHLHIAHFIANLLMLSVQL